MKNLYKEIINQELIEYYANNKDKICNKINYSQPSILYINDQYTMNTCFYIDKEKQFIYFIYINFKYDFAYLIDVDQNILDLRLYGIKYKNISENNGNFNIVI